MHVIKARNVNGALGAGLDYISKHGYSEQSRNGPVLVASTPVTTVYERPWERVLFSPTRDANPFFHLMESLWMLAGRNDIAFPRAFNSRFGAYSDDGVTQRGAYGYRWRRWFGYDQLRVIVDELRRDPASRRCVLAMWDGSQVGYCWDEQEIIAKRDSDLQAETVDKPCNTHAYFRINHNRLDITVCNRSNDILWGAYGANAVHFSFLQEYMAAMLSISMGTYYQVSNNYHLYTDVLSGPKLEAIIRECDQWDRYRASSAMYFCHLVNAPEAFDAEVAHFCSDPEQNINYRYANIFFEAVAHPVYNLWVNRKDPGQRRRYTAAIADDAWRLACDEWIQRREAKTNGDK